MTTITEEWKPIPGYEEFYEVSDLGRVKSLGMPRKPGKGNYARNQRILKHGIREDGYSQVTLYLGTIRKTWRVHHLVLLAFVGEMPPGQETRHINGDPSDNRLANLRYGTHTENNQDRVLHGTHHETRKTKCPRGHELIEPNLMPSQRKRGKRSCLACARAKSYSWQYPETKNQFQALADSYYSKLMKGSRSL